MARVQQQPPKQYMTRHDYSEAATYEINWVNAQAKTRRRWHTDHLLDGVMGWHAKDLPQAQ
eukprot:3416936-Lingulodinium_polyedra.AAC.1